MDEHDEAELPHLDHAGRPTLRTVAALAGVHSSTVSRALSPDRGKDVRIASDATLERIHAVAAELGYTKNPAAAGLRLQRTDTIGVLVPRLTDLVLSTIYEGIEEGAALGGSLTLVANTHDEDEQRFARARMLLDRRVDGLVIGDARRTGDPLLADLAAQRIPVVLISRTSDDVAAVTVDDRLGGRLAAEHLLGLGHRRVAVLAGEPYASTGHDRTLGFREAFDEADAPIPDRLVVHGGFNTAAGRAAAATVLATDPEVTAIFASNDFAAIGAMGAARDAGRVVGRDIGIVGFNDVEIAGDLPTGLTTIRSPHAEMGRTAAALLLESIDGRTVESVLLPPTLVVRGSTVPRSVG